LHILIFQSAIVFPTVVVFQVDKTYFVLTDAVGKYV